MLCEAVKENEKQKNILLLWTIFYWKVIMLHTKILQFSFPKKNQFKLQLKELLLIKKDKLELNKNICTHSLEPFA